MKELTEASVLQALLEFRRQHPHEPLWIRPTRITVYVQASKKAWRTRKKMFSVKPWRGLYNKAQLPVGSVMLTVKASNGEELSVAVKGADKDKDIMATLRSLLAACAEYEESLAPAEEKK